MERVAGEMAAEGSGFTVTIPEAEAEQLPPSVTVTE
jgi:hypothetical protein